MRRRPRDPSSLPHHLLVSTDVSPVGAITVVRGPDEGGLTAEGEKASVSGGLPRRHGRLDVTEPT